MGATDMRHGLKDAGFDGVIFSVFMLDWSAVCSTGCLPINVESTRLCALSGPVCLWVCGGEGDIVHSERLRLLAQGFARVHVAL